MPRPEKVQAVADIKERIEGAHAVFIAEYAGLSVKDQQALRRNLRENGAEFKVVKMSMARLAAAELNIDTLEGLLLGQTGLAFADDDPAVAAKVLKDFAGSHGTFAIKGGLLGLEFLPPEKIAELADLDPRDVLLAKIVGAMQAPMAILAGLLAALPRNTASVLQQLLENKEAEAPAETAAEEAPEAESSEEAEKAADDDTEVEDEEPKTESAEETPEAADASFETDTDVDASADAGDESDDVSTDPEVADAASTDVEVATDAPDTDDEDQASEDDATEE